MEGGAWSSMTCNGCALCQLQFVSMVDRGDLLCLPGMNGARGEVSCCKDRRRYLIWLVVPDTAGNCIAEVSIVVTRVDIRCWVDRSSRPYLGWTR